MGINTDYETSSDDTAGCVSVLIVIIVIVIICTIAVSGVAGRQNVDSIFSNGPKFKEGDIVYTKLDNRKCIVVNVCPGSYTDYYDIRTDSRNNKLIRVSELELSQTALVPDRADKTEIILEKGK